MAVAADADGKDGVHMECNQLPSGCAGVFHTRLVPHPDLENLCPSVAADQAMDGLNGASRGQKSLLGYPPHSCIVPMLVQQPCI